MKADPNSQSLPYSSSYKWHVGLTEVDGWTIDANDEISAIFPGTSE